MDDVERNMRMDHVSASLAVRADPILQLRVYDVIPAVVCGFDPNVLALDAICREQLTDGHAKVLHGLIRSRIGWIVCFVRVNRYEYSAVALSILLWGISRSVLCDLSDCDLRRHYT